MTTPAILQELAAEIDCTVSLSGAERLLTYLDAMLAENQHINLTAIRDPEEAVLLHALDSLALGSLKCERPPVHALDLGTGNGFPGIAIACLFPGVHVHLLDRRLKKLSAITRILESAGFDLAQFTTIQMDAAEGRAHGLGKKFDLITTRAVGPPLEMGRLAAPLLVKGGRLLTWLSDEAIAPQSMRGRLNKRAEVSYTLPVATPRLRRLVEYRVK